MNQFVIKHDVPILDEHDLVDNDNNVVFSLTPKILQQIAENNNRRVDETGDETPIIVGHTKDEAAEDAQPEIVGWARHFTVKRLFNTGRKAIFCTARFLKDKLDLVKKFPRRSVELWLKKMLIDPIALLGPTTPERDLGLLKFSMGEQKYSPIFPEEESMDKNELVQAVLEALKQTDVWQFMESKMSEEQGQQGAQEPSDAMPVQGNDAAPPPDADGLPEDQSPVEEQEPKRYSGVASGSNTSVSNDIKELKDQNRKLQAALAQNNKDMHKFHMKFQRERRANDLLKLESEEGLLFDKDEEIEQLAELPEEQYQKRLDVMRKRYQRVPTGVQVMHTATRSPGAKNGKEKVDRVVEFATEKQISYSEALKTLEGDKVF